MRESEYRGWRPFLLRLAFELAVVFVGVYGAFALSSYQAEREAVERRRQIQLALVREIGDITAGTREAAANVRSVVAGYDSALAAGGSPPLMPMLEPFRMRNHMWEATLGSGGLALLDVGTIYRLSRFYNELNAGAGQLEQLRELSESVLIPALGAGTAEFYDGPGRLRPKYGWYLDGLRNLRGIAERVTLMGDSIVADLDEPGRAR